MSQKLRPASPDDLQNLVKVKVEGEDSDSTGTGMGGLSDPASQPSDLDAPWPFHFQEGDRVWIRTVGGRWFPGVVIGQTTRKGATRQREGLYYPVQFASRIRKYFAPLNGDIKPSKNAHIRGLLKAAGWIDQDE